MSRHVHYKRVALAGLGMSMTGTLVLAAFAPILHFWVLELSLGFISVGLGTLFPVSTVSIQNAVPLHQLGTATATTNFFRSLGGALIVALFGAIVLSGVELTEGASLETLKGSLSHNSGLVAATFSYVFFAAFVGFCLSFLFLFAMKELPLRGRTEVTPRRSGNTDLSESS